MAGAPSTRLGSMRRRCAQKSGTWALVAGVFALAACRGETRVLLELDGNTTDVAQLRLQLVTAAGVVPGVYRVPEDGSDVRLPGSVVIRLDGDVGEVGVVVWAVDPQENVVATAHTKRCVSVPASQRTNVALLLATERTGWTPSRTASCKCAGDRADMCDAPTNPPPADGGVTPIGTAGSGGSGTAPAADGGTAGAGGAAGSKQDAAMASDVASPPATGNGKDLFGFEHAAPDWTAMGTTLTTDASERRQGLVSLSFTLPDGGTATIRSRAFDARDLGTPVPRLGLEVFMATAQPDAPRQSNIRLFLSCPGVLEDQFVDYQRLSGYPPGGWVTVVFQVPGVVTTALAKGPTGCTLRLQHEGNGLFRYDDLRFLP